MDPPPCELCPLLTLSPLLLVQLIYFQSPFLSYPNLSFHSCLETSICLPGFICYLSMCCCAVARRVQHPATPWTAACQASLPSTICQSFLKLISIESVMPSNHLILCYPPLLLPWIFPKPKVFSNELALCSNCPKYWSFSFSISPSNEYSGSISFRMDWFDILADQGTVKSLHHHVSFSNMLYFLLLYFTYCLSPQSV